MSWWQDPATLGLILTGFFYLWYRIARFFDKRLIRKDPSPYRRHGKCRAPIHEVRSVVTDELLAGICGGCGDQVSVEETIAWGTSITEKEKDRGFKDGGWAIAPGMVWDVPTTDERLRQAYEGLGMYAPTEATVKHLKNRPMTDAQRKAIFRDMRRHQRRRR